MNTRYKAIISYCGKDFYGYQIQKKDNERSVEGEIEKALRQIFSMDIKTVASGRTDRGVHALGQVLHFDLEDEVPVYRLRYSLNSLLPKDIHIESLEIVDASFHARYSVEKKEYHYLISTKERSPFTTGLVYNFNRPLDLEKIKEGINLFLGEHSFHNFCSNDDSFVRTILSFNVEKKDDLIIFKIVGNGFRRYMVRMLVGTLIQVGLNKLPVSEITRLLDPSVKERVRYKVPPDGLYLVKVDYKEGEKND